MKKMRILAIILVLSLALTACGSKNAPEETAVPATTAAPAAETDQKSEAPEAKAAEPQKKRRRNNYHRRKPKANGEAANNG